MKLALFLMRLSLVALVIFTAKPFANAQSPKWLNGASGYARAVELQRESNASMVVYFYTDWCPYCRALDDEYLSDPSVKQFLQRTVAVRINPEDGPEERKIANRYGVNGYPTFLIMQNESARPRNIQPFRKGGNHLTPQQFARACEDVISIVPTSPRVPRNESREALERASDRAVMNATRQTTKAQIVEVKPATAAAPVKTKRKP